MTVCLFAISFPPSYRSLSLSLAFLFLSPAISFFFYSPSNRVALRPHLIYLSVFRIKLIIVMKTAVSGCSARFSDFSTSTWTGV